MATMTHRSGPSVSGTRKATPKKNSTTPRIQKARKWPSGLGRCSAQQADSIRARRAEIEGLTRLCSRKVRALKILTEAAK